MKKFSMLSMGALIICMSANTYLHAQNRINITGSGGAGKILTASITGNDVEKIEWKLNGKIIATSGSSRKGVTVAGGHCAGSAPNQLSNPNGVFIDKDNNIWVADYGNARVQKFTPGNPNGITIGGNLPNAPTSPVNLFVRSNGDVYVADYFEAKVKRLAKGGTEWVNVAGQNNELDLVRGVWVDNKGNVFCTQYGYFFNGIFELDGMILKYPPNSSAFEIVAGHNGIGPALNQFSAPGSIMLDDDGSMYIADGDNDHGLQNARVLKWAQGAAQGVIVAGGNGQGEQANQCPSPGHAFVDKKGNVYVSNYQSGKITKWKPGGTTGEIVAGGNGIGDAPDQFMYPYGIFISGKYLYVVDTQNNRIQRFDLSEPNHHKPFKARHPGTYCAVATFANGTVVESNNISISGTRESIAPATLTPALIKNKAVAYPNPSKNSVTVSYTAEKNSQYILELTDLSGKVLMHKALVASQGVNSTTIDIVPFAKGSYFVNVIKPDKPKESILIIKE